LADEVTLLEEDDVFVGFKINDKVFYADDWRVEVEKDDLKGFNLSSIPDGFWLALIEDYELDFQSAVLEKEGYAGYSSVEMHIYRKYWYHKFGASQYSEAMKNAIEQRQKTNKDVEFDEIEDDGAHLFIRFIIYYLQDMPIDEAYRTYKKVLAEIEGHTERILEGEEISAEILKDEVKFTIEVLLPLFRNMGFSDVKYNHGKREYGKDVTFSEIDKFGARQNYGVQVKAGNLSGEAGAEIDTIIGQINDAFLMSYIDTTSREKRYISFFIIAISGRFTENAKDKIFEKINQRNIYFFDIDKIQELLANYMKKAIR